MKSLFVVDGKPFFSIGGQVNNSSSSNPMVMANAIGACKKLGMNTISAPVHFELFEPKEGIFDYSQIDMLIKSAREAGLKLVVLWFGTWKNGNSHYVPAWMKIDKKRFPLAKAADGVEISSLSPFYEETRKADEVAFVKLCKYIQENNDDHTVIGVQVENEPGLIGAARDYSKEANALFKKSVPDEVAKFAEKRGNWEKVFGFDGAEFFSSYYVCRYIDQIAEKGKEVLNLPMYINVWLGEMYSHIPGTSYPSGGAVSRTFAFWKYLAKHIDAIAPDIYLADYKTCDNVFKTYSSSNNIFYLPESAPTAQWLVNGFRAIADYNLTGFHMFGVDILSLVDSPLAAQFSQSNDPMIKALLPLAHEVQGAFKILANFKPLIEEYQGTGRLYAVGQYEGEANDCIDFGDYLGSIRFLNSTGSLFSGNENYNMDNRHYAGMYPNFRAKGFIVYKGNGEFYLAGDAFKLILYPKKDIVETTSAVHASEFLNHRSQGYVTVTEGFFTQNGQYIPTIIRNGDETDGGIWVTNDVGVVHVQMN